MLEKFKDDPSLITGFSRVDGTFLRHWLMPSLPTLNWSLCRPHWCRESLQLGSSYRLSAHWCLFLLRNWRHRSLAGEKTQLSFVTLLINQQHYTWETYSRTPVDGTTRANVMVGGHLWVAPCRYQQQSVLDELLGTIDRVWGNDGPNMSRNFPTTAHKVLEINTSEFCLS